MLSAEPVAVVSHDAGGAEILSSYVRRQGLDACFALAGPALAIFERKLGPIVNLAPSEAISRARMLLCGTSSPASLEREAIALARHAGKPSVAILDHWINYRERFISGAATVIPDEIWTVDGDAFALARECFPEVVVRQVENPYRADCMEELAALERHPHAAAERARTLLYVTEPTSVHAARIFGDAGYWGYTELTALDYFLASIRRVAPGVERVVVRPHPSEEADKYATVSAPVEVVVRKDRALIEELAGVDRVAGCNSMAMVVASWAGRGVICAIPPGGRGFNLAISGIVHLKDLAGASLPSQSEQT
jgi:hypothetical protein